MIVADYPGLSWECGRRTDQVGFRDKVWEPFLAGNARTCSASTNSDHPAPRAIPVTSHRMQKWRPLIVLSLAQFLMVLDQAVMNVAISQLVEDFDTTVTTIQAVITFYALVMATLMITGGKIGDIIGRRRAFIVGLVIYGAGSALTAASWSVPSLFLGWSVLEGVGAALVLPALVALLAANYQGRDRITAFGVIGGVAGVGIAAGPIVGGFFTTNLSWRWVFVGEVIVACIIVLTARLIVDAEARRPPTQPRHRGFGALRGRPRADRVRDASGELVGMAHSQTVADRTVRLRPHPVRDPRRRHRDLGVRPVAGSPRARGPRPTRPNRTAVGASAAFGAQLLSQPEPDPARDLLHPAAVSADRARLRRTRDRHQDASDLRHHVHHLVERTTACGPVRAEAGRSSRFRRC